MFSFVGPTAEALIGVPRSVWLVARDLGIGFAGPGDAVWLLILPDPALVGCVEEVVFLSSAMAISCSAMVFSCTAQTVCREEIVFPSSAMVFSCTEEVACIEEVVLMS